MARKATKREAKGKGDWRPLDRWTSGMRPYVRASTRCAPATAGSRSWICLLPGHLLSSMTSIHLTWPKPMIQMSPSTLFILLILFHMCILGQDCAMCPKSHPRSYRTPHLRIQNCSVLPIWVLHDFLLWFPSIDQNVLSLFEIWILSLSSFELW